MALYNEFENFVLLEDKIMSEEVNFLSGNMPSVVHICSFLKPVCVGKDAKRSVSVAKTCFNRNSVFSNYNHNERLKYSLSKIRLYPFLWHSIAQDMDNSLLLQIFLVFPYLLGGLLGTISFLLLVQTNNPAHLAKHLNHGLNKYSLR